MKRAFDRILVVMFENQYRSYVTQDRFLRKLAAAGADMTNYFGAFHPSQTNYLASLAGEVCAVTNDTAPEKPLMQETLVDLLEAAGLSWKAYMEGYPGDPWKPVWKDPDYPVSDQPLNQFPDDGKKLARYYRKHNAFASFHSIQADEARWRKIVSEVEFWDDLASGSLPEYSWFTPDIWNDGHYLYNTHTDTNPRTQLIPQISGWLEYVFFGNIDADKVQGGVATNQETLGLNLDFDLLLTDPEAAWRQSKVLAGTLVVVTFDEADYDAESYDTNYDGPNQIYTVLLGDMIPPGTIVESPYNHYSLLKTVERNFDTGDLGKNDRSANWFRFLWRESFSWSDAASTGISGSNPALATLESTPWLLYRDPEGSLLSATFDGTSWSAGRDTRLRSNGPLALVACEGRMLLVYGGEAGALFFATEDGGAWSPAQSLGCATSGAIAMTAYVDLADSREKALLCWQGESGFIQFLIYDQGRWQSKPGEVGQLTDGPMALAQMGPSLFLPALHPPPLLLGLFLVPI